MKFWMKTAATAVAIAMAGSANAASLYSNDFESGSTSNLSGVTTITTAPGNGQKFLGILAAGSSSALTLNTAGLSQVTLNFDLYGLSSLDGDDSVFGGDFFDVNINGGASLLHNTFSNITNILQSYGGPGSLPGTGSDAALTGVLGYNFVGLDHTYHLTYTTSVSGASTVFNFIGNSSQTFPDEGFGIDNIVVSGIPGGVPEPASWALMLGGFGLTGAALRRGNGRRRQRTVSVTYA
jgi:hypothetical protein